MRLRLLPPLPDRWRFWRRRRPARAPASVQETFLPVRSVSADLVELDGGRGYRAIYRVWGIDLAAMDATEQEGWLALRKAFVEHTTGYRVQELARSRRNRLEEYLTRSERLLERGAEHGEGLSPQEVAVARERIAHLRRFAEEHFLTAVATYLVVPGATPDETYERADDIEAWLDRLRLPHVQLQGVEIAELLADVWGLDEPPDRDTIVPLLDGRVAPPLSPDGPDGLAVRRVRVRSVAAAPALAALTAALTAAGPAAGPAARPALPPAPVLAGSGAPARGPTREESAA
jgi:hypothetical protein